jgi:preprotein translocase subunit SecD
MTLRGRDCAAVKRLVLAFLVCTAMERVLAQMDRVKFGQRNLVVPEITTDRVQRAILEIRLAETKPRRGLLRAPVEASDREIFLYDTPLVTNVDVEGAYVIETHGRFNVGVTLTETGADAMARSTAVQRGKLLAIILDGRVVAAPMIAGAVGAQIVIDHAYTRADAERIASSLSRRP